MSMREFHSILLYGPIEIHNLFCTYDYTYHMELIVQCEVQDLTPYYMPLSCSLLRSCSGALPMLLVYSIVRVMR